MPSCYLTIDDSPSPYTGELANYLDQRNIPALFFIRGDMIERYGLEPIISLIQKGFVIGNHAMSHTHFSKLSYDDAIQEIKTCDTLIEQAYEKAGIKRPGKYFRFPHLDRGAGAEPINFNVIAPEYRDDVMRLFTDGVRVEGETPSNALINHKNEIQKYLAENGFCQPFENINYSWWGDTEIGKARDCLITFSTSDWMLLNRHRGKWPYKTMQDLKNKIDNDPWLNKSESHAIILMHDKLEQEFPEIFKTLIDHMIDRGYEFLSYS
jgi:peptidoglycan/xylan/chitin deacetylase (PgdA/CDA1 family)